VTKVQTGRGLSEAAVKRVVEAHLAEIKACAAQSISPQPVKEITISFSVDPSGKAREIKVTFSSQAAPNMERCLIEKLRAWSFPAPEGGATVKVTVIVASS
jgi:TonB family protein